MVKAKDIIKEFVPYITLSKSPKKPAKLPKFNVFYWHRRYTTHKPLKQNTHIWDKVKNGDFEYSPYAKYIEYEYWWMAEEIAEVRNSDFTFETKQEKERDIRLSYNRRLKNLRNDFQRDEFDRLEDLKTCLRKTFGGTKSDVDKFINHYAEGTTDEVIRQYFHWLMKEKKDDSPF
jgi:hypothetical protein